MSSSLYMASIDMHRLMSLAALVLVASVAKAQDTTVVVVRHLPAQQDTTVTVRHLAPAAQPAGPVAAPRVAPAPYGVPRYGLRTNGVYAKDPYLGTSLSFLFPGGGQYYAGNNGKGFLLTALAIGAPIVGYANVNHQHADIVNTPDGPTSACNVYGPQGASPGCRRTDWTPAAIGLTVGIGSWLYGIATAGTDVQHWNQAHGVRFVAGPGRVGFAVAVP
jgi:hypothetical protein